MHETSRKEKKERPGIAVFAYSEVGYVCLEELLRRGANVRIVFTHTDDPAENIWFRSVRELAEANGIPARTDGRIGAEATRALREAGTDLLLSFYYRAIVPKEALDVPRLGAYNMHGALLPKYRGRACVNWAVLNGETETGATLHVMTEHADRGDIVAQEAVPIDYGDTALDVFRKVAEAARDIIARTLPLLESGSAPRTPQDETQATTFGRRRPEDGLIDWSKTAARIYDQVRALTHPFPGAFAEVEGKKTFIWRARPLPGAAEPGAIVSRTPLVVGTGEGLLEVERLQREGEEERADLQ